MRAFLDSQAFLTLLTALFFIAFATLNASWLVVAAFTVVMIAVLKK